MQQTDYQIAKDHFLLQPVAYKEVARNEIVAESDNHYRIGSAVVQLTDDMVFDIDKYLGITSAPYICSGYAAPVG